MPYVKPTTRPSYLPSKDKRPYDKDKPRFHAERRWRLLSERIRRNRVACEVCDHIGIITPSTCVDHAIRVANGGAKYDKRNLIAMCNEHHAYKTTIEIQGYKPDVVRTTNGYIPDNIQDIIELVALQSWQGVRAEGGSDGKGEGGSDLWII